MFEIENNSVHGNVLWVALKIGIKIKLKKSLKYSHITIIKKKREDMLNRKRKIKVKTSLKVFFGV